MAILHVRGIPEPLYKRAQRIADSRGKSLSQLVIEALERLDQEEAARRKHARIMAEIRANMAQRKADWPGGMPEAVDLIRAGRDEREQAILGAAE
jgi:hypothetical protein